jgi:hypothetical protein
MWTGQVAGGAFPTLHKPTERRQPVTTANKLAQRPHRLPMGTRRTTPATEPA